MPTIQEIISEARTIYNTTRPNQDQALSLKRIHRRLYTKIGRDTNQWTSSEDFTVADQDTYNLPTGCKINNIVNMKIQVEDSTLDGKYTDFEYYSQEKMNDYDSYFTRALTENTYYIYENGEPFADSGRSIIINYYKDITTDFTDLNDIPSLDTDYHDYLVYMLVAENASCGNDPDTEIADYWRKEADEYFWEIKVKMDSDLYDSPNNSNEAKEMM
jgi:hypothetical protein